MNTTLKALLELGIDNDLSEMISSSKITLKDLKLTSDIELRRYGFTEANIRQLRSTARPSIPDNIIKNLFYKSRFCCAVCRDKDKGVVIHHIEPWETSHNHDESNLILLCLDCHDKAHTTHQLSKNLAPTILKKMKQEWESQTWKNDSEIVLRNIIENNGLMNGVAWDWFNVKRLFEVLDSLDIDRTKLRDYVSESTIDSLLASKEGKSFWLQGRHSLREAMYLEEVMKPLINEVPFKLLNSLWTKEGVKELKTGDFIVFQKDFFFKEIDKINGTRQCYSKSNNIRLNFIIDPWYCMSVSSYHLHLRGHNKVTTFGIVRGIEEVEGETIISASLLAIGMCFGDIKKYLLYL